MNLTKKVAQKLLGKKVGATRIFMRDDRSAVVEVSILVEGELETSHALFNYYGDSWLHLRQLGFIEDYEEAKVTLKSHLFKAYKQLVEHEVQMAEKALGHIKSRLAAQDYESAKTARQYLRRANQKLDDHLHYLWSVSGTKRK